MTPSLQNLGVWLINLEDSIDRRRTMEDRLNRLGLSYTLFSAVDGSKEIGKLKPNVDLRAFRRNMGRHPLPGDIGCYFSHQGVWREFVESDYPVGLVLEDDVVFHDEFLKAVHAALSVSDDWDLVRLCALRCEDPDYSKRVTIISLKCLRRTVNRRRCVHGQD